MPVTAKGREKVWLQNGDDSEDDGEELLEIDNYSIYLKSAERGPVGTRLVWSWRKFQCHMAGGGLQVRVNVMVMVIMMIVFEILSTFNVETLLSNWGPNINLKSHV